MAHQLYTEWGAVAKANQIEANHSSWFTPRRYLNDNSIWLHGSISRFPTPADEQSADAVLRRKGSRG
jgi:hypothetical protein